MPERPARNDEPFYVGYLPRSPKSIASLVRAAAGLLLVIGLGLGALLVSGQARFDDGDFEFGVEKRFRGLLVERPYPLLLVPGESGGQAVTHYLSATGKFGADELVEGFDVQAVEVTGSLIHNERQRMIEVHGIETITDTGGAIGRLRTGMELQLGERTLSGEIVDSKCHLGVMKPGRGKAHKACAIRCISGGVPPVLRVEDDRGGYDYLLLVSLEGKNVNDEVLGFVAEPVEITGNVVRRGDLLLLYADPSTYRLLN
jgi:hypothetical protein